MTNFVLVHGSGQRAGSWARVASLLEREGHTVELPEMPQRQPELGLEEHASVIAAHAMGRRAVVVAHSLCGAFLPLVASRCDCVQLVYLAAVVPEQGKSVRDQFQEDPEMFHPEWIASGSRWFDESQQAELAREFLLHDCDDEAVELGLRTLGFLDPQALVMQPAPLATSSEVPSVSIVATRDRTLTAEWGRRISRRVLGRDAVEVDAGHCPHLSQPEHVAALLHELAP